MNNKWKKKRVRGAIILMDAKSRELLSAPGMVMSRYHCIPSSCISHSLLFIHLLTHTCTYTSPFLPNTLYLSPFLYHTFYIRLFFAIARHFYTHNHWGRRTSVVVLTSLESPRSPSHLPPHPPPSSPHLAPTNINWFSYIQINI